MEPTREIVFDIETYGTLPGSVISQISAMEIDPFDFKVIKFIGPINIDTKSCQDLGMTMETQTIEWWIKQSKEAQEGLLKSPRVSITSALAQFLEFLDGELTEYSDPFTIDLTDRNFNLWCHASFDFPIVNSALSKCKLPLIPFWKCKDMRTIMGLTNIKKNDIEFEGIEHDSMSDVYHESKLLSMSLKKYRSISRAAESLRS